VQSIETKYFGPTSTRGAYIRATASGGGGSVTVPVRGSAENDENHARAAADLMTKLGWDGEMVAGSSPSGRGYVFVFTKGVPRVHVAETPRMHIKR